MEKSVCCTCLKPKATLECGACKESVCKNCAQFLEEGSFSFLAKVPEQLSHGTYCSNCFDTHVSAELADYTHTLELAKDIHIFENDQGKETRFFNRKEKPLKVENCADREDVFLRLGFLAAKAGFNTLIDVAVTYEKVVSGTYKTHKWKGSGVPTNVAEARLNRKSNLKSPSR
ncbi:hypothetical protein [Bdellovibrio sp. HCB337]|uniref:hypothetical protein n=1 Tax=Bdellovibrio sp. HCB337 TaxID=3394358 RepID=UPI0039A545E3